MDNSNNMSAFAKAIMDQKYSHIKPDGTKETWPEIAHRVATNVMSAVNAPKDLTKVIEESIAQRKFIPGGRYLYSASRPFHQSNNCILLRAEDSREGWSELLYNNAMALMTGAGVGVVYSDIRPRGSIIRRTGGECSGPTSLMQMINESARHIRQGGSRRCLTEDTLVYTTKGLKRINQISKGEEVYTSKGTSFVTRVFDQGNQSVDKINTRSGDLYSTSNHRWAVLDSIGGYEWKETSKLIPGDMLLYFKGMVKGHKTQLPKDFTEERPFHSTTCKDIIIPELTTDVAWLIGLIHGDGWIHNRHNLANSGGSRIEIACSREDKTTINKAVKILSLFGVEVHIRPDKNAQCDYIIVRSQRLVEYFEKYFKQPNTSIEIHECILQGTKDIRAAYLAGLLDSDGSIKARPINLVCTVYYDFARQVQAVYNSLGIVTRLKKYIIKKTNKVYYKIDLAGFKNLYNKTVAIYSCKGLSPITKHQKGYLVPRSVLMATLEKEQFLNEHWKYGGSNRENINYESYVERGGTLPYVPVMVKSVERDVKTVHTYDIEVAKDHEFFANGSLCHNSALWAGLHWNHPDVFDFIALKDWKPEVRKIKETDFNFPAPMDGTNISVILDNDFFFSFENPNHKMHEHAKNVYWLVVKRMLKTAEPGFSIDIGANTGENGRNPCNEVCSYDNNDVCNLGSINMARINSLTEMAYVTELATAFLLAGSVYSDLPYEKVRQTREKNRRLGLGLMGLHEHLLSQGKQYEKDEELKKYLEIYSTSTTIAHKFSDEWNISKSLKTRAIAPNGTIGIVAETTTGIEPIFCTSFKRRYWDKEVMNYQYVIDPTAKKLIDQGISPNKIEDAYLLSNDVGRRLEFQAFVQQYVDHAISSTINLPAWGTPSNNLDTVEAFGNTLMKNLPNLRGVTCYPDGARGGQPLEAVDYKYAASKVGEVFYESVDVCDITKGGSCGA